MPSNTLTLESAKQANFNLVDDPKKGRQALHNTIVAYRANRRSGTACVKSRSEVAGSGKKLWKQKGTGRARMGSRRSPIWVGGGRAFGPKPRDYSKIIPRKIKQLALRKAITERIKDGDVITTVHFAIADGKTKSFLKTLHAITDAEKVLILGKFDELTFRAARNVPRVLLFAATDVNAEHLLDYAKIILTGEALETLAQRTSAA